MDAGVPRPLTNAEITFDRWSTKPGSSANFHPFASMLDNLTMTAVRSTTATRRSTVPTCMRIRTASSSPRGFAAKHLAPSRRTLSVRHLARHHFDSVLLANSCTKRRSSAGVRYRDRPCHARQLDEHGAIASVSTREDK